MPIQGMDSGEIEHNWTELADLLCDQFVALGHRRPAVARVVGDDRAVLLVIGWSESEGESLLERVAPALAELVRMDLHREIVGLGTSVTDDGCRAMVSFILGEPIEECAERFEAVRSWSRQAQRNARRRQTEHRQKCHEMRRLRAEMIVLRAELRTRRRRLRREAERPLSR